MVSIAFIVVSILAMAVFLWSIALFRKYRDVSFLLMMPPLTLLWYDSFVIAVGSFIGEGAFLEAISHVRYVAHALFLPTWIIAAGAIARRAGLGWAKPRWVMGSFCLAATIIFIQGLIEILQLELLPACIHGTLRYVSYIAEGQACRPGMEGLGHKASGPPWVAILPTALFIIIGIMLWVKYRWPWLCVGAVLMLAMASFPQSVAGPLLANIAEPFIAGGALLTLRYLLSKQRDADEQASSSPAE